MGRRLARRGGTPVTPGPAEREGGTVGTVAAVADGAVAGASGGAKHWSEPRVKRWLEGRGWRTLASNVASRHGELDLVMDDAGTIVFVEVRYRRVATHGGAAASVDGPKRARLRRAAAAWLARRGWHDAPARFDAVLVRGAPDRARVTLLQDAF